MEACTRQYLSEAWQENGPVLPASFRVAWKSPSNIALVKYWGKRPEQMPQNPSVSMTLSESFSEVYLSGKRKPDGDISLDFSFGGKENEPFRIRLTEYLEKIKRYLPFLSRYTLTVESNNSFPHSAGIASSASSLSALALCLTSLEDHITGFKNEPAFRQKASFLSRLGSGSACRSVYPGYSLWGKLQGIRTSSDEYALQLVDIHPVFRDYRDAILVVSSAEKDLPSSQGHQLMSDHPFAEMRYSTARGNAECITAALRTGDEHRFGEIVEQEALMLHALIMTSGAGNLLLRPGTVDIINNIRAFREQQHLNMCFTLDAGPNIHLIYPSKNMIIRSFIENSLKKYCENGFWINDQVGNGPVLITESYE
jgi:diphosphomevalonate decarboxylase